MLLLAIRLLFIQTDKLIHTRLLENNFAKYRFRSGPVDIFRDIDNATAPPLYLGRTTLIMRARSKLSGKVLDVIDKLLPFVMSFICVR